MGVTSKRPVVVKATVEYVIEVPADWDREQIMFHLNESRCASNLVDDLRGFHKRAGDDGPCLCHKVAYQFVRDATTLDLERNCMAEGE